MDQFISALLLNAGYNAALVCIGAALLGLSAGAAGTFLVLSKRALACKAAASATLPGVALAFILMASLGGDGRNIFGLMAGAAITAWLAIAAIEWIASNTRLREDAAIGAVLSASFGAGIALLTTIQSLGIGRPAGLANLLLGSIAGMLYRDALIVAAGGTLIFAITFLFRRPMTLVAFDAQYAAVCGYNVRLIDLVILTLGVAITVVGLKIVGLVLIVALLIVPSVTARYWTDRPERILILASAIGAAAAYIGAAISASAPNLPAGAVIVLVAAGIFVFSMLFSPGRGLLGFARRSFELRKYALVREGLMALERGDRIESNAVRLVLHMGKVLAHNEKHREVLTDFGRNAVHGYMLDERRWKLAQTLNPDIDVTAHYCAFTALGEVFTADRMVRIDRVLRQIVRRIPGEKAERKAYKYGSYPTIHEVVRNVKILKHSPFWVMALLRIPAKTIEAFIFVKALKWSYNYGRQLISELSKSTMEMARSIPWAIQRQAIRIGQPVGVRIVAPWHGLRLGSSSVAQAAVLALIVGVATFGLLSLIPPRYLAETQLEIATLPVDTATDGKDAQSRPPVYNATQSHFNAIKAPDLLLEVAASLEFSKREALADRRDLLDLVVSRGNAISPPPHTPAAAPLSDEQVLKTVLDRLEVFPSEESRTVSIQFSSQDKQLAAQFVYRLAVAYRQRLRALQADRTAPAMSARRQDITQLEQELKTAESRLKRMAALTQELTQAEDRRSAALSKLQRVKNANDSIDAAALAEFPDLPDIRRSVERLAFAERQFAEARVLLPPTDPIRQRLHLYLKRLRAAIGRAISRSAGGLQNEFKKADRRVVDIRREIGLLRSKASAAFDTGAKLRSLEASVQFKRRQLDRLRRQLEHYNNRHNNIVAEDSIQTEMQAAFPILVSYPHAIFHKIPYSLLASLAVFILAMGVAKFRTRSI